MNNVNATVVAPGQVRPRTIDIVQQGLAKRYRAERRFRFYGLAAVGLGLLSLLLLFVSIIGNGYMAFWQTQVKLDVFVDPAVLNQGNLSSADYAKLIKQSLQDLFPDVKGRRDKRDLYGLVSSGALFSSGGWSWKIPHCLANGYRSGFRRMMTWTCSSKATSTAVCRRPDGASAINS
jgi:hypothetical protein